MATGYNIRVGDAEREETASQLRDHYADGRLTLDELNERLDEAFAAKTRADLNGVLRDLPVVPRPLVPVASNSRSSGPGSGRQFAFLAPVYALFLLCAAFGSLFLFGLGNKPLGIVLLLAALAFLRRIFGRARRGRRRGRCGRR
jgi:Domain of unknown function (DUF1707)